MDRTFWTYSTPWHQSPLSLQGKPHGTPKRPIFLHARATCPELPYSCKCNGKIRWNTQTINTKLRLGKQQQHPYRNSLLVSSKIQNFGTGFWPNGFVPQTRGDFQRILTVLFFASIIRCQMSS